MIVKTTLGAVEGLVEDGVAKFLGIPFAEAPVNENRFKKPVPKKPWEGTLNAKAFSAKCPQLRIPVAPDNGIRQDEDCLYMNIYAPENMAEKKPVFVWIYGGALSSGEGSTDVYEGSEFVKNGNVVVVNFNYRVGAFGGFYNFASYPGCEGYEANCGLFDILEALRFVKTHISDFGGDPDRITIGGESAGASLTALLLSMPEANGLFSQAAMESTFLFEPTKPEDRTVTDKILQCAGLSSGNAGDFLKLPTDKILEAVSNSCDGNPLICGAGLQQADYFTENLGNTIKHLANDVPAIIGFNHDEAVIFGTPDTPEEQIVGMTKVLFESVIENFIAAEQHESPVYLYRYDYVPAPLKAQGMGAIHSAEMPCVFHNLNCPGAAMMQADPESSEKVSNSMHQAWISFINGKAPWEVYQENLSNYMNFDIVSTNRTNWRL